jgi:hypothetical protein
MQTAASTRKRKTVQAAASTMAKLTLATDNPVIIDTSQTTSRSSFHTVSICALHMKDGGEPQIKTVVPAQAIWPVDNSTPAMSISGRSHWQRNSLPAPRSACGAETCLSAALGGHFVPRYPKYPTRYDALHAVTLGREGCRDVRDALPV